MKELNRSNVTILYYVALRYPILIHAYSNSRYAILLVSSRVPVAHPCFYLRDNKPDSAEMPALCFFTYEILWIFGKPCDLIV